MKMYQRNASVWAGFTFTDLMTLFGVLALIGLLVPVVIARAGKTSLAASCSENMRHLAMAWSL